MARLISILSIVVATAPIAGWQDEPSPQSDEVRILGTWRITASIGDVELAEEALGTEVTFTADLMTIKPKNAEGPGDWLRLRYHLDPAQDPKHIDTRHRLGPEEEPIVQLGIYSLKDGELRFGLAGAARPRPRDFASIPQAFVLERVEGP